MNKTGSHSVGSLFIENKIFFRQGQVGDSKNHLERETMDLLNRVTEEKLKEFHLKTLSSEDDEKSEVTIAM